MIYIHTFIHIYVSSTTVRLGGLEVPSTRIGFATKIILSNRLNLLKETSKCIMGNI